MNDMIENLSKTISYICPFCSGVTQKQIGIFRFSGDMPAELYCSDKMCNEPCAIITPGRDKYKIAVDCPLCGETHSFVISKSAFWNKDLLSFSCPNAGVDIFFIGKKSLVTEAVDENNKMLESIADKYDNSLEDSDVLFHILDDLHRILNEDRIVCKCGNHRITPVFDENGILLVCDACGNKMLLSPTEDTINRLSSTGKFVF